jgi:hypothetical protein
MILITGRMTFPAGLQDGKMARHLHHIKEPAMEKKQES